MRGLVACAVVVSLSGFLPASGAASPDLRNDPQWIALMGPAPRAANGGLAVRRRPPTAQNKSCTASANCGGYQLNCSEPGAGTCQGVHQNCSAGIQGFVTCGSTTTYCNACPPPPDPECPYGYYPTPYDGCCYPIEPGYPPLC
jgi:hypothetical protein